ncbi:MAG: SDR family NAD(P)-dependent oxidoreductase, partial [Bacteroidota bacterium]
MMRKLKIAVLTGVTDGIGKEVALGLVGMHYELFVMARNKEKFEHLKQEAMAIDKKASLHFYQVDLSLVQSTETALARIKKDITSIDLLYQSAGLIPSKIALTAEGVEKTFAVSYLTRYLILKTLLPLILKSKDKMVLNMAGAGQNGSINFEDINFQNT